MDIGALRDRLANLHTASAAERRTLREALLVQLAAPDMPLRALAAGGLGRVGDERVVPALLQALQDPAPLVQWRAAHALRALHANALVASDRLVFQDGAAFEHWKSTLLTRLVARLSDPAPGARQEAAVSLQEIGEPATLPALVAAALDSEDPVCWEIGQAVVILAQQDAGSLAGARHDLVAALRDGDPWVRQVAAGLLAALGDRAAVAALLPLLHDPDRAVRRGACAALGRLGDPATAAALAGRLADDDPAVRGAAAAALGQLGDPYAVPALAQVAGDEDPTVRGAMLAALGQIGGPAAQALLLAGLRDADAGTRLAAIGALAVAGSQQALKPLAACGRDRSEVGGRRLGREAAAAGRAIRARLRAAGR